MKTTITIRDFIELGANLEECFYRLQLPNGLNYTDALDQASTDPETVKGYLHILERGTDDPEAIAEELALRFLQRYRIRTEITA